MHCCVLQISCTQGTTTLSPVSCRTLSFSQCQPWMSIPVAPVEHVQPFKVKYSKKQWQIEPVSQWSGTCIPTGGVRVFLWFICPRLCMFCFVSHVSCVPSGGGGHSTQRTAADQSRQRHTMKRASTRRHTAHNTTEQSKVVYRHNSGGQPHHPPRAPTPAQHPTPKVGARPTARALHPHTATAAHKQGTHVEHHQGPTNPRPNANTAPTTHTTTKATPTHNIEGMLP